MSTYTALVSRDGKFWHIEVPEVNRVTQARNINEVDDMARDLIAILANVEPDSFELDVRIELPEGVQAHLLEVERAREAEAKARSHAATELRAAAAELKHAGLSVRELGSVLGVSYQRASQLTSNFTKQSNEDQKRTPVEAIQNRTSRHRGTDAPAGRRRAG
jgi:4-hydroxyphenylpyruvate dioxygenase-like putative hemolysin